MLRPQDAWRTFLNVLFPPICLACSRSLADKEAGRHVCERCWREIAVLGRFACSICGGRLLSPTKSCHPKALYILLPAMAYDELLIQRLIWQLKYRRVRAAATPLTAILIAALADTPLKLKAYSFVAMPLHRSRLKERGFNQAELLARPLAEYYERPLLVDALLRVQPTEYQAQLRGHEARLKNVCDAFVVPNAKAVRGQNIILVDDVATSGATLHAAATALKKAGAHKIVALVVAKA